MNNTIIEAIINKKLLVVTYNGSERLVEPHTYGLDKSGQGKLRVFQVAENEDHSGWRLFNEAAITDVRIADGTFAGSQPGYNKDDKHIPTVYAQL